MISTDYKNNILPYEFHESSLLNISLNRGVFYFRFAVAAFSACITHPQIKENEVLIVDIICRDCKINEIYMPNGDVQFINSEVLTFFIDKEYNCSLQLVDFSSYIEFCCKSFDVKVGKIVEYKELGDGRSPNALLENTLYQLPIEK